MEENGNSILGATSKDLTISDLNATTDSGNYKVVVSNDFGSFAKQITLNVFSPTAVKMVVGDHHSLYLDAMGFPYGLGNNHYGEIGSVVNAISIPTRIINEQVAGIATSTLTSLILKKMVRYGGGGGGGGGGHLQGTGFGFQKPGQNNYGPVKDFAAGEYNLGLDPMDLFWTSGYNSDGRLGDGSTVNRSSLVKVMIRELRKYSARENMLR